VGDGDAILEIGVEGGEGDVEDLCMAVVGVLEGAETI
jgi:hypothetical protein